MQERFAYDQSNSLCPCLSKRRYRNLNFMVPLLEGEDEGQEQKRPPMTCAEHSLSETKCQWCTFFLLNVCFIVACVMDLYPSVTIVLAYLAFIPSLIMYKWFRKIYRRGGLPLFPDTVREYTLAFWYAHLISFVAVIFWILLVFEVTLASTWRSVRLEVEEEVGCEGMVKYDLSCPDTPVPDCGFVGPFEYTDECYWESSLQGCAIFIDFDSQYYPCTTLSADDESFYNEEGYQEKVDLETFQRLRSSFSLNMFIIFLTLGKGVIEQSVKYYFSQKSRKKFPTMLSENHIDGMLYLVTIIGIAFGTAEAILDVAVDLMADDTILFLLVNLFFGTLNHGVTSYIIGIGLCKRYILRQNEQTYFRIIAIPVVIQWCFDYGKWWLLDYSSDMPSMQLFFTLMCVVAFIGGYCVLSRQRLNLRDEFDSGEAGQIESSGVQLQVTSYCTEEDDGASQGGEGTTSKENESSPPPYEDLGELGHIPDENFEHPVQEAVGVVDSKEDETRTLLTQNVDVLMQTTSLAVDGEKLPKKDSESLSEVHLLDGPPISGKLSKREAAERRNVGP